MNKRFVYEYANYTLRNLKGCNSLYIEYMENKIYNTISLYAARLISEDEAIQIIGNFGHKQHYTFIGDNIINEYNQIVYTRKDGAKK